MISTDLISMKRQAISYERATEGIFLWMKVYIKSTSVVEIYVCCVCFVIMLRMDGDFACICSDQLDITEASTSVLH